jgi:hypothetical protein
VASLGSKRVLKNNELVPRPEARAVGRCETDDRVCSRENLYRDGVLSPAGKAPKDRAPDKVMNCR